MVKATIKAPFYAAVCFIFNFAKLPFHISKFTYDNVNEPLLHSISGLIATKKCFKKKEKIIVLIKCWSFEKIHPTHSISFRCHVIRGQFGWVPIAIRIIMLVCFSFPVYMMLKKVYWIPSMPTLFPSYYNLRDFLCDIVFYLWNNFALLGIHLSNWRRLYIYNRKAVKWRENVVILLLWCLALLYVFHSLTIPLHTHARFYVS